MDHAQHNRLVSFIWGIADDVLRDVYQRGKYRDCILPMVVIRRLDVVLGPTKAAVLAMHRQLDAAGVANQSAKLREVAGQAFYNASPFRLDDIPRREAPSASRPTSSAISTVSRPTSSKYSNISNSATRFPPWSRPASWAP